MGTWGLGPFENDCAGDWLAAMRRDDDGALDRALAAVHEFPDYLEVDEGQAAIAAAEFVAAAFGRSADPTADVRRLLEARAERITALPHILQRARDALARVLAEKSEIAELWDESPQGGEWRRSIAQLDERLAEIGRSRDGGSGA